MFVVDDLVGWLVGRLADAGYQKLSTRLRGGDQARALNPAVEAAVLATVRDIGPPDEEEAGQVAELINKAFRRRDPVPLPPGQPTVLEALQAGIAGQLSIPDDAGQPAVSLPGVRVSEVASRLTGHLVREIQTRGSRGGPLADLAGQLNHDVTHLHGQRLEGMLAEVLDWLGHGQAPPGGTVGPVGWPLAEVGDPFALEVHRPIQPDSPQAGLPELPPYVPRDHDRQLARVVEAAAAGRSGIVVLVGGSSTGKTRACWEALGPLRGRTPEWRLWHPIDPSRPDAALRELPAIGPRTVVWLNEAQFYLQAPGEVGKQVAAGLREVLRDRARAPVLVLATLWPEFWHLLISRLPRGDDPHTQARELLAGHDLTVPAAFTGSQLQQLRESGDVRLVQAAEAVGDGQVIQFLAGVPELLALYRNAPPATKALIHAAMDGRRLGMRPALPYAFLEAAAPGYLTDAEWDALGEDWLVGALAYTAAPAKGIRGPLTRIRPRPAHAASPTPSHRTGPVYLLADYLDQHGRATRSDHVPPPTFWAAATSHADPGDLRALGHAAQNRGLRQEAAQLFKNATANGDTLAASQLVKLLHTLHPADLRPSRWATTHATLAHWDAVVYLLRALRTAGTQDQVTALADRAAADAPLEDPSVIALLLATLGPRALARDFQASPTVIDAARGSAGGRRLLRDMEGWPEHVGVLAARAAVGVPLDDPWGVAYLLEELRNVGAEDQVGVLLARGPAERAVLDNPAAVARLLETLREAGEEDQVSVLLARGPADRAALDYPSGVASLLRELRKAGAEDQVSVLLARDPAASVAVDDPDSEGPYFIVDLLRELREAGAAGQVSVLAARAAAGAVLDNPAAVARLLETLREAGEEDQVSVLLARGPAERAALDSPYLVADLLKALREAGADGQVGVLAARVAAGVAIGDPDFVADLVEELRTSGAQEQAEVLAGRSAQIGQIQEFRPQAEQEERFRFGRKNDGSPAQPWGWEDLDLHNSRPPVRLSA